MNTDRQDAPRIVEALITNGRGGREDYTLRFISHPDENRLSQESHFPGAATGDAFLASSFRAWFAASRTEFNDADAVIAVLPRHQLRPPSTPDVAISAITGACVRGMRPLPSADINSASICVELAEGRRLVAQIVNHSHDIVLRTFHPPMGAAPVPAWTIGDASTHQARAVLPDDALSLPDKDLDALLKRIVIDIINPSLEDPFVLKDDPWLRPSEADTDGLSMDQISMIASAAAFLLRGPEDRQDVGEAIVTPAATPAALPVCDIHFHAPTPHARLTKRLSLVLEILLARSAIPGWKPTLKTMPTNAPHLRSGYGRAQNILAIPFGRPTGHEALSAAETFIDWWNGIKEPWDEDPWFGRRTGIRKDEAPDLAAQIDAILAKNGEAR